MIVKVKPHFIEIEREEVNNEFESNISICKFEFDDSIPSDFIKEAYFSKDNKSYKVIIQNNQCNFPSEILKTEGNTEIGVIAYKIIDDELIRYSPSPTNFYVESGSYKENTDNSYPITPTELEQYKQAINDSLNEFKQSMTNYYNKNEIDNKIGTIDEVLNKINGEVIE